MRDGGYAEPSHQTAAEEKAAAVMKFKAVQVPLKIIHISQCEILTLYQDYSHSERAI